MQYLRRISDACTLVPQRQINFSDWSLTATRPLLSTSAPPTCWSSVGARSWLWEHRSGRRSASSDTTVAMSASMTSDKTWWYSENMNWMDSTLKRIGKKLDAPGARPTWSRSCTSRGASSGTTQLGRICYQLTSTWVFAMDCRPCLLRSELCSIRFYWIKEWSLDYVEKGYLFKNSVLYLD